MFGIGMPEMLLLLALALIVIGPKKLPDLAKSLGRAMREFKKATNELKETLDLDEDLSEVKNAFDDLKKDTTDLISGAPAEKKTAPARGINEGAQDTPDELDTDVSTEPAADGPDEQKPTGEPARDEPTAEKKLDDLKKAFDDWSATEKPADGTDTTEPEHDSRKPKESEKDA